MSITTIRTATDGIHQLAKQASLLATGLQNAAPPGTSPHSVQYLLETAAQLEKTCGEIKKLCSPERGE